MSQPSALQKIDEMPSEALVRFVEDTLEESGFLVFRSMDACGLISLDEIPSCEALC